MKPWLMMFAMIPLAACTPVDHWSMMEDDLHHRLRTQVDQPIDIPASAQPAMQVDAPIVMPDDGSPLQLSIEQAVMLAMQNNRDLRVQQFNPVIAGTFEQIERGRFDPQAFANLEYREQIASQTSGATGTQFDIETENILGEVGIRQPLPTGTDIEVAASHERAVSNRSPEQQTARIGLTVTQSLLQGFGPAVNLASVRQAQLHAIASQYELRGFTEALLADIEITYWQYVLAEREIAIFQSSLDVAQQQLAEIEQRIEVGVLAETEAAAARAEVARRQQALIDARSVLESQRLRFIRLINPVPTDELDLRIAAVTDPRVDTQSIDDLPERIQLAHKMRPDLNEAQLRLDQNRLELLVTRNGLLPRLDLFIAVGKTGFADKFSHAYREIDGKTYDFAAGISFTQHLGNRAADARHTAARASRQQAAEAVANLRQLIQLDVRLAVNELERARQQIQASTLTRELEEQTVHAERERFDVGNSTALLVAQAQRDLLAARIAEVRAIVAYRIALVHLYQSEGTLLERRGITLGER